MSATYQTQIMDTSAVEVPLHEPLADVEALDLVLQISRKWNLNRLFRYLRVQHTNQSESKGLDNSAATDLSDLSVAITDKDTAMADFRAWSASCSTQARTALAPRPSPPSTGRSPLRQGPLATRTRRDRVTRAAVTGTSA